jgi:hypothetical protein
MAGTSLVDARREAGKGRNREINNLLFMGFLQSNSKIVL